MTLSCAYFMAEIALSVQKVYPLNVLEEWVLICLKSRNFYRKFDLFEAEVAQFCNRSLQW